MFGKISLAFAQGTVLAFVKPTFKFLRYFKSQENERDSKYILVNVGLTEDLYIINVTVGSRKFIIK